MNSIPEYIPKDKEQLRAELLNKILANPGENIARIIRPYRPWLGEQTLRNRLFELEKEGKIIIERRFRRAYLFPVNEKLNE